MFDNGPVILKILTKQKSIHLLEVILLNLRETLTKEKDSVHVNINRCIFESLTEAVLMGMLKRCGIRSMKAIYCSICQESLQWSKF